MQPRPTFVRPEAAARPGAPRPRQFSRVNWVGLATFYRRELLRVLKYYPDSILGPTVLCLLYLAIFHFALGGEGVTMGGVALMQFVAPGLAAYIVCERAFDTTSISILFDKLEGMMADLLMAPLTALERSLAYAGAAASAGLVTGAVVLAAERVFVDLPLADPAAILFFALAGALLHALAGVIVGLWAARWDHYAAATTFFVLPFGFLSGTFYSIEALPPVGRILVQLNPVFYVIDGVRYGFTGRADGSLAVGVVLLIAVDAILLYAVHRLLRRGYRLKP
ncbi:MAG: transport permease protein [Alphaproteobacteria bacterium]|nr:MAG: transport permease protein [Alphaproteobacteria bacterium]